MSRPTNRQRVINAAIKLAERDGVRGVTVDSVAAEAGLTKGGVQYHFSTKEAMMDAVFAEIWQQADAHALEHLEQSFEESTHEDRLAAAILSNVGGTTRAGELLLFLDGSTNGQTGRHAREFHHRWAEEAELTTSQRIALLAADGLWLHDASSTGTISDEERKRIVEQLLEMVSE